MRILLVIESGSWADHHLAGSLRDNGHSVDIFYYGTAVGEFYPWSQRKRLREQNRALLQKARELANGGGLDLIFCYVYDDFLLRETARALQRLDVPMVNYNVDMTSQWYRQTRTAQYFTRMLCAQRDNMHLMARHNAEVRYFPMAARWASLAGEARSPAAPVVFTGAPTQYRTRILSEVVAAGVPCAIYGRMWREKRSAEAGSGAEKLLRDAWYYTVPKYQSEGLTGLWQAVGRRMRRDNAALLYRLHESVLKGAVTAEELGPLFRGAAINLGFTRTGEDGGSPYRTQLKLRDFEVPLAGGFYLVEHVPEYAEHFELGKEVQTWKTTPELLDRIRYYLDHPAKRKEMARAARARAIRQHTWQHRFNDLFADLGLKA